MDDGTSRVVQEGGFLRVGDDSAPTAPTDPTGPSGDTWQPAPPDARRSGALPILMHVVLGFDLAFMGLSAVLGLVFYLTSAADPGSVDPIEGGAESIWLANMVNLLMFGLVPLAWILATRVRPIEGTRRYLHLHSFWPSVGHGIGYAALLLGLVIFLFLFMDIFGIGLEETGTENRFGGITWPLVFVTAAVAGVAEEIFFRGMLQKWIGVWGQAVVFGLFHVAGGLLPFFVTGAIGLLFGYLVKRGRSLWLVITAHFTYDVVLLASAVGS